MIFVPFDCYSGLIKPLDLNLLQDGRSIAYSGGCLYILLTYCFYHLRRLCNDFYGLSALVSCWSSVFIRKINYKLVNVRPFYYTVFAVSGIVGNP